MPSSQCLSPIEGGLLGAPTAQPPLVSPLPAAHAHSRPWCTLFMARATPLCGAEHPAGVWRPQLRPGSAAVTWHDLRKGWLCLDLSFPICRLGKMKPSLSCYEVERRCRSIPSPLETSGGSQASGGRRKNGRRQRGRDERAEVGHGQGSVTTGVKGERE